MKNKSAEISWIDADIIRFKKKGTLIPPIQRKVYEKIRDESRRKTIIDIGCSIGVGSNILSHKAKFVLGVDINSEAIKFAELAFERPNLHFAILNIEQLEHRESRKFDVIVMLETLEHLTDYKTGLRNFKSFFSLKSVGFISIPNINDPKDISNKYHLHHWTLQEFYNLLSEHFKKIIFYANEKLSKINLEAEIISDLILAKVEGIN